MGSKAEAVSDAGPLIHLAEIKAIRTLKVFNVLAPTSVIKEVTKINPKAIEKIKKFVQSATRSTKEEMTANKMRVLYDLEKGESDAISLAKSRKRKFFLSDDLNARKAAREENITPIGTIGILFRAYRNSVLTYDEVRQLLKRLYEESSLYMTERVYKIGLKMIESYETKREIYTGHRNRKHTVSNFQVVQGLSWSTLTSFSNQR